MGKMVYLKVENGVHDMSKAKVLPTSEANRDLSRFFRFHTAEYGRILPSPNVPLGRIRPEALHIVVNGEPRVLF